MTKAYTEDDVAINEDQKTADVKLYPVVPFFTQLWTILKIRFIHRYRSKSVVIEFGLEILFFIFATTFATQMNCYSEDVPTTELSEYYPFSAIIGPDPRFGIIPDDQQSRMFLQILNQVAAAVYQPIAEDTQFFKSFTEYQTFINENRQIEEMFLAVEQITQDGGETYKVSANGLVDYFLPDYFQSISTAILIKSGHPTASVAFQFQPMAHQSVFNADWYNGLTGAIFSYVFTVAAILVTGTFFVEEAEKGIRDLLTFYGLSNFINNIAWFIISFVTLLIPAIFFSLSLSIALECNFGVLFLLYFVGCLALSSLFLCIITLYPKGSYAMTAALAILLTYFIFIFLGYFAFLTEIGYDVPKNILSIFPNACLGFALLMICCGKVNSFDTVVSVQEYNVKYAYVYLLVEAFVYFGIYLLIDYFKERTWLPPPSKWHFKKPLLNHEPILIEHLTKEYGDVKAVNDMSFSLEMGEILAIVGPNGAGKTTLMSLLSASKVPTSGEIKFQGVDISKYNQTMHRMTGYCPQDNIFLSTLTPVEWLKAICTFRGEPDYDFSSIITALGLDEQLKKRVGEMSGGNKRKVCLAASLVCDPPIILLDEATSGVDFTSRTRIWSLISSLKNKTIIMATHTLEECEKIADKIMVLSQGRIDDHETPTQLRQKYKCGYIIDTEVVHQEEVSQLIAQFNEEYSHPVEVKDDRAKFILPMDESLHISDILQKLTFPYLLNVQSLEEKIFDHVQKVEEEMARKEQCGEEGAHQEEESECQIAL